MRAVVMKFGGSSVVDATAIRRVVRIVSAERDRGTVPVVVVSAFGGVTDRLLGLAEAARKGQTGEVRAGVPQLLARHLTEARQRVARPHDPALAGDLQGHFTHLSSLLQATEGPRAAVPREL